MGFMIPVAEYLTMYVVEDDRGETFLIPESVCGSLPDGASDDERDAHFADYLGDDGRIGRLPVSSVEKEEGWYGRLSAPGYLDCTSWDGPHETADQALDAVKEEYNVDDDGDDADDVDPDGLDWA